jgi:cytochrome b
MSARPQAFECLLTGVRVTHTRVRVWDLPTRVTHGLLIALLIGLWLSARSNRMALHRDFGYVLLAVLVFRIYWGFVGSTTARFATFVRGPRVIAAYLRGSASAVRLGHNPLGALSVLFMLTLLLTQVFLGLFSVDVDGIESGPWSHWVGFGTGRAFAHLHRAGFEVIEGAVGVHLIAVLAHAWLKRDNLILPMLTGWKRISSGAAANPVFASWARAGFGAALIAALVAWLVH